MVDVVEMASGGLTYPYQVSLTVLCCHALDADFGSTLLISFFGHPQGLSLADSKCNGIQQICPRRAEPCLGRRKERHNFSLTPSMSTRSFISSYSLFGTICAMHKSI